MLFPHKSGRANVQSVLQNGVAFTFACVNNHGEPN